MTNNDNGQVNQSNGKKNRKDDPKSRKHHNSCWFLVNFLMTPIQMNQWLRKRYIAGLVLYSILRSVIKSAVNIRDMDQGPISLHMISLIQFLLHTQYLIFDICLATVPSILNTIHPWGRAPPFLLVLSTIYRYMVGIVIGLVHTSHWCCYICGGEKFNSIYHTEK